MTRMMQGIVTQEDKDFKDSAEEDALKRFDELRKEYLPNMDEAEKRKVTELADVLEAADKITLYTRTGKNMSQMTEKEKQRFKDRVQRKIAVYDAFKNIGLNLYAMENRLHLRKLVKLRDKLIQQRDGYLSELEGKVNGTDKNAYRDLFSILPDTVKDLPEFREIGTWLGSKGFGNGEGLEKRLYEANKETLHGTNFIGMLDSTIIKYQEQIGTINSDIRALDESLADKPHDPELLQERSKKYALRDVYLDERKKYEKQRDTIGEKVLDADRKYSMLERRVEMRKVCVETCKQKVYHLDEQITKMEEYLVQNRDLVVLQNHFVDVDKARNLVRITKPMTEMYDGLFIWATDEALQKARTDNQGNGPESPRWKDYSVAVDDIKRGKVEGAMKRARERSFYN